MKKIPVRNCNKIVAYALVDDEDYEYLMQWKWRYFKGKKDRTAYARHRNLGINVFMHQAVQLNIKEKHRDHRNGNGLDNRRCNIREATSSQNNMNAQKRQNSSSIYKGVSWHKRLKKWTANIRYIKSMHIGCFKSEEMAAWAYDFCAMEIQGEFARLNFKY